MTARINVTLPWPPAECSPNSRVHHKKRAKVSEIHKILAFFTVKGKYPNWDDLTKNHEGFNHNLQAMYEFCPPNKIRRDLDNFQARCKPYLDGICDALGIDDSQIKRSIQEWGGVTDGGQVIITIEAMEEQ